MEQHLRFAGRGLLVVMAVGLGSCGSPDMPGEVSGPQDLVVVTGDGAAPRDLRAPGDLRLPDDLTAVVAPDQGGCGACPNGQVCEADAGVCVECRGDADCARLGDPLRRLCDRAGNRCVPCLLDNDACPAGQYCRDDGQGKLACVAGCKADLDCQVVDGGGARSACCDHACVDTASSAMHCGACGKACMMGQSCCGAACADLMGDARNCGACGKACAANNAVATCRAGVCGVGACLMGFADCDQNAANGCEVSVASDAQNCGGCGKACSLPNASAACIGGACALSACNMGFRNCDGNAVNGCEIDSFNDSNNCGGCGSVCAQLPHAMAGCKTGVCVISACAQGFGNCDKMDGNGCEVDVTSSLTHCGACGNACAMAPNVSITCTAGKCTPGGCVQGYADCDNNANNGCEVKLATDPSNCGACGKQCMNGGPNAMPGCAAGVCSIACNKGWGDCDNNPGNGCEKDVTSDAANCGSCGKACGNGEACVASMCSGCAAGRYSGPASATALGFMVTGTLSLTLGAPMGDQYPVIAGSLSMTGPMQASATATVTGTLDCSKKTFTGTLTNGGATALGLPPLPFTGTVSADYKVGPPSFSNGMLTAMGGLIGNGAWTAAYLGP